MTFRLGILATEYPPAAGGMEQHAASVVSHAAERFETTLVTWPHAAPAPASVRHLAEWTGFAEIDSKLIAAQDVNAWLILNAGWASDVARGAGTVPTFAYVHGNDFLSPWVPGLPRPVAFAAGIEERLQPGGGGASSFASAWWRRKRVSAGLRKTRLIFANSTYTRERCLRACGLPGDRVSVVAPGIDEHHFQNWTSTPSDGALRLLTVSRLSSMNRRKNIEGLLEAIVLVRDEIKNITLTVVGEGDDRSRLVGLARQQGIEDRVHFVGRLNDEELDDAYREANLFVLAPQATRRDVEGFGMVYVEAAARGVPVIGTRVGGVPDAICDGVSGIFADSHSAPDIAAALFRFLREREHFDPIHIRRYAERHRSERTSAQLFDQIVAHKGRP